jgi:two-component system, NarL family, response regulator NreC
MPRILIVDDHEIVRVGLRMLCATRPDWQVCGEAENAARAIAKVLDERPDAVILDLSLPAGMNGFEAAREIRRIAPATKIILFSLHEVPVTAREVGADAFVSKSRGVSELVSTIERLMAPAAQAAKAD